jgi:hypothetical protein
VQATIDAQQTQDLTIPATQLTLLPRVARSAN